MSELQIYLAIGSIFLALLALFFNRRDAWQKKKAEAEAKLPGIQATISQTRSVDGWRPVQLHLTAPPENSSYRFDNKGWRILEATLLLPRQASLARAREDDNGMEGPIWGHAQRNLTGRPIVHPQPFAMEFFIRFGDTTPHADAG